MLNTFHGQTIRQRAFKNIKIYDRRFSLGNDDLSLVLISLQCGRQRVGSNDQRLAGPVEKRIKRQQLQATEVTINVKARIPTATR